jgi:hypothetical protein
MAEPNLKKRCAVGAGLQQTYENAYIEMADGVQQVRKGNMTYCRLSMLERRAKEAAITIARHDAGCEQCQNLA